MKPKAKDIAKAARLYEEFREQKPQRGRRIDLEIPKSLMVMGELDAVLYRTTRRNRTEKYKHTFSDGSRPFLCAAPGRNQLFIIEGRYHVTDRGIVDLDPKGREIEDN